MRAHAAALRAAFDGRPPPRAVLARQWTLDGALLVPPPAAALPAAAAAAATSATSAQMIGVLAEQVLFVDK